MKNGVFWVRKIILEGKNGFFFGGEGGGWGVGGGAIMIALFRLFCKII